MRRLAIFSLSVLCAISLFAFDPPVGSGTVSVSASAGGKTATINVNYSVPTSNPPVDPLDTDGNGLPDAWELKYFGHLGVDPNADPDGDGLTNLQEYQGGTDPLDYYNGKPRLITPSIEPNGQLDADDSFFVTVTDEKGNPLVNAPVNFQTSGFTHRYSSAAFSTWDNAKPSVTIYTDTNGIARVYVVRSPNF